MITAFAPTSPAELSPTRRTEQRDAADPAGARGDLRSWEVTLGELADVAVDLAADVAAGQHPRTHLTLQVPQAAPVSAWPREELVERLLAGGVDSIRVVLGTADPATQTGLVGFLVHAQSFGLPVGWQMPAGDVEWVADPDLLVHLPPPDGESALEVSWRLRHSYGLCYWRHGLSFATVTDLRDAADAGRFTLSEAAYVELFTSLDEPRLLASLSPAEREVLQDLLDSRLVLVAADHVVRLPFRLRRWPMPLHDLR